MRICFGSLFVLIYQARGQGVKSDPLCGAILAPFGVDLQYRDNSLPGHLKNGVATEREICLEDAYEYDDINIEVSGEKLLEAFENGRSKEISKAGT